MADIVMAYSASHAPMMSADKESAPPDQAERFFGGLAKGAPAGGRFPSAGDRVHDRWAFHQLLPAEPAADRDRLGQRASGAAGEVVEDTEDDHPR